MNLVIRGFGTILPAVIGDGAFKMDMAGLLEDKSAPVPKEKD